MVATAAQGSEPARSPPPRSATAGAPGSRL